ITCLASDHAANPPAGFVDVQIPSIPSITTHSDTDGQSTVCSAVLFKSCIHTVSQAAAPPTGLVETAIRLRVPTATHSVGDGQSTAFVCGICGMDTWCQVPAPPVGSVET